MDTDRNLLFGVMALQADLIDSHQFIESCLLWTARKEILLADVLIERGRILPSDKAHVDYLLERKLQKHGGDAKAGLADIADGVKHSLVALGDADIQHSLAGLPRTESSPLTETVDFVPGDQERYALTRLHATGGVGRIWLARDLHLGRDVALKDLRPDHLGNVVLRTRFLKEAQITGQLEHPGIVPVYELVQRPGDRVPFYTMRFVKGRTLSEATHAYHQKRATGQDVSLEQVSLLNAFVTVCNTLAYAHSRGVIHRDIKGQNIVVGEFGEVVILDWGLAKVVDQPEGQTGTASAVFNIDQPGSAEPELTVHGQILGTPAYMAPEQAAGRLDLIDYRTDVYGLGAILYEILTDHPPFAGSDTREVMRRVREEEPRPPRRVCADVPPALESICLQALAKEPAKRYASAGELAREVQLWQDAQRREAEEALRASEELYHSLVETIPMNVWRKDAECRFTFGNRGFCETTKIPLMELIGKDDFDLFPMELAEKYRRDDRWVLETGKVLEATEEHLTAEGERLYVRVIKLPVFDGHGRTVGTQGIFWDVRGENPRAEPRTRTASELTQDGER